MCASSITDLVDTENTPYYVDRWNFLASFPHIDIFAFSLFTSTLFQSLSFSKALLSPRLVSSSSQGTLVASDCEPLEDDNDQDFEL